MQDPLAQGRCDWPSDEEPPVSVQSGQHGRVRSSVGLAELPYVFTQLRPLTAAKFLSEARKRAVLLIEEHLEALHRLGVLVPLFRVRRDGRRVANVARRDLNEALDLAHWEPTSPQSLLHAKRGGLLCDPARERFIPRHRVRHRLADSTITYQTSIYLNSPYQLGLLPLIREVVQDMRFEGQDRLVGVVPRNSFALHYWGARAARTRDLLIAATALEPVYYPRIVGRISLPREVDFERYDSWRRALPPGRIKRWLGVGNNWLREAASDLLTEARRRDPLEDWTDLLSRIEPGKWWDLRGDARSALDLRIAGELVLRYYDALVEARQAQPLPTGSQGFAGPFGDRLKPQRTLDALLMDFGLSPHPRLVLVVEGATERLIVPRVMQLLDVRVERDFISIEDAGGVDRDISSLLTYLAPQLSGAGNERRYVRYERPPSRFLVVFDAEGTFATNEQRRERRRAWIERLMAALPEERRNELVREQIARLVFVDTWNRRGDSFEFAHFTDLELARAVHDLDRRTDRPSVETMTQALKSIRVARGNIDGVLDDARVPKPRLADALWPTLERKIQRARPRGTARRIPVVRTVMRAVRLAQELPRRNFVLVLEREG